MKASNHIQIIYTQRPLQEPYSGGEIEFRFEQPPKKGQCFYTEPIDTGMGAGDHWLHFFFIDQMGTDEERAARRLVWGDVQVFNRSSYIPALPAVSLGAVMDSQTGHFQLGVQMKEDAAVPALRIGWRARREALLSEKEQEKKRARQFYITNAPKKMKPGMIYFFETNLPEEERFRVRWQVLGEQAGQIDEHGKYTAPDHPGLFEVEARIEGTDLRSSVFVMVASL